MKRFHLVNLVLALFVAALAAPPAWGAVDLTVQSATFVQTPKAGNCNTLRVQVRNIGDELGNEISSALVKVFPSNNAFQIAFEKKIFFSAFVAGGTQQRDVANVELPSQGTQYTVQVLVDADNHFNPESNENNNINTQFVTPSSSCGGGACDLVATFSSPTNSNIPATYDARFTVRFENAGGSACPAKQVQLTRSGSTVATASLQGLNPGQNRSLSLTESRNNHPPDGTHTYAIGYQGGHSDADNANHTPSKTVTFTGRTQPGGGGPVNPAGCDLKATFTAPGNTASANGNTTFTVRFDNGGSAQCAEFKVKLMSYNGRSCGGYGTQIGGSRAFRPVGALSPGGSSTVSWTARLGSPGTRCLKLDYSPKAYNDDNNSNHHPQRVVNFQ